MLQARREGENENQLESRRDLNTNGAGCFAVTSSTLLTPPRCHSARPSIAFAFLSFILLPPNGNDTSRARPSRGNVEIPLKVFPMVALGA